MDLDIHLGKHDTLPVAEAEPSRLTMTSSSSAP